MRHPSRTLAALAAFLTLGASLGTLPSVVTGSSPVPGAVAGALVGLGAFLAVVALLLTVLDTPLHRQATAVRRAADRARARDRLHPVPARTGAPARA